MKYALIENGIVKQVQPYTQVGFVEVPDYVCYGMVDNGDGTFTVSDKDPVALAEKRVAEIYTRLSEIDVESVRPIRAVTAGTATAFDTDKLAALDTEAEALRLELASL